MNNPTNSVDPMGTEPLPYDGLPGLVEDPFRWMEVPVVGYGWGQVGSIPGTEPGFNDIPVFGYTWGVVGSTFDIWSSIFRWGRGLGRGGNTGTNGQAKPDFVQYTVNVNPPGPAGTLVGGTVTLTRDKFGNWYFGAGYNVGRGATVVSASAQAGWLLGIPATPQSLNGLLTRGSWTAGGSTSAFVGGFVTTDSSGTAVTAGPATPQYGFSWSYSTTVSNLWNWLFY